MSQEKIFQDLIQQGYRPVEINLHNQTNRTYTLSQESIDISLTSAKRILQEQAKFSKARKIGFSILGFVFWPMIIPSTLDSVYTYKKEKFLKQELQARGLKEEQERVLPYSQLTRILYIKEKDFQEDCTLSLKDTTSGEKVSVLLNFS